MHPEYKIGFNLQQSKEDVLKVILIVPNNSSKKEKIAS
jgi:hypothetical protein